MYHTYGTGTWILDCCRVPTPFIGWGDILRFRLGQSWAASATWIYLYPRGGPWIGQHDILSTILVFFSHSRLVLFEYYRGWTCRFNQIIIDRIIN